MTPTPLRPHVRYPCAADLPEVEIQRRPVGGPRQLGAAGRDAPVERAQAIMEEHALARVQATHHTVVVVHLLGAGADGTHKRGSADEQPQPGCSSAGIARRDH